MFQCYDNNILMGEVFPCWSLKQLCSRAGGMEEGCGHGHWQEELLPPHSKCDVENLCDGCVKALWGCTLVWSQGLQIAGDTQEETFAGQTPCYQARAMKLLGDLCGGCCTTKAWATWSGWNSHLFPLLPTNLWGEGLGSTLRIFMGCVALWSWELKAST